MMIGTGRDMFWSDYKKYGYTEADFEDDESDVVADAKWEDAEEQNEKLKCIENMEESNGHE